MPLAIIVCLLTILLSGPVAAAKAEAIETRPSQLDPEVLAVVFSGGEIMHYAVSWSGGLKIGDIYMDIHKQQGREDAYAISAKVKDYGPLEVFYPVDDRFVCFVSGPMKLPYRYEVEQKEGFGKKITRLTRYDQDKRMVWYRKNKEEEQQFELTGSVYNEFASFIITRALVLREGEPIVVPTFADRKRHEVQVSLVNREERETMFGKRPTLVVQPKMEFKGLYEKSGNTTLWLTDDRCRVPVEIHSRIVIGSLVAELVDYSNPACPELTKAKNR
ncbi:DUF3108 domain-containing protein [Desulfobulbus sp.]|uniref:DUF3108 domain-containing protein n=1 Tax=Desulfobulbus sp. TaxID=895 RepID=UPI00286F6881|nr:DUF3108 domain-containing protein [Desulfobulbus sp.]